MSKAGKKAEKQDRGTDVETQTNQQRVKDKHILK